MAINFPASPSTNDTHTENAITWIFNGTSWDAQGDQVTATSIGLGNVDNTADTDKPISTATQTALDDKQDILAEGAFVDGDKTKLDASLDIPAASDNDQTSNAIAYLTKNGGLLELILSNLSQANTWIWLTERGTQSESGKTKSRGFKIGYDGVTNEFRLVAVNNRVETVVMAIDRQTGVVTMDDGLFDSSNGLFFKSAQDTTVGVTFGEDISNGRVSAGRLQYNGAENRLELLALNQPTQGGSPSTATQSLALSIDRYTGEIIFHSDIDFNNQTLKNLKTHDSAKWAVFTDWHMFTSGAGGNQRARDGFNELGSVGADFAVSCGDLIDLKYDESIVDLDLTKAIERYAGCPIFHALGNHELDDGSSETFSAAVSAGFYDGLDDAYMSDTLELNTGTHQNRGYYYFYHKGSDVWHIVLNSVENNDGSNGWHWSTTQRDWLQAFLDGLTGSDKRIIVYSHIPPKMSLGSHGWRTAEETELHDMLNDWVISDGKCLGVYCGHRHDSALTKVDNINYVRLRNSEGGGTGVSDTVNVAYDHANSTPLSFATFKWDDTTDTLTITGHNGETSRSLSI